MVERSEAGQTTLDRRLRQALLAVVLASLAILVYATVATDRAQPPIRQRVVAPGGAILFTGDDIRDSKEIFQRADLMDFGTLYGNGAYFGPHDRG